MFTTLLIANRGEIACRIIRTCKRLGVRTVAVYSDADAGAQHVRLADVAVHIGGSRPQDSYLLGDKIIAAALQTGAQAIHPGFGFLSENADFADAVEQAGIRFVGPRALSMRKMGSKAGAKQLMEAAGVPVVPGYSGEDQDPEALALYANEVGFPLMIKAAHGGGGKGMRVVREAAEFNDALSSCQREARNAFGRDRVLLERYVETPRHIEIQIFGDMHGQVLHLNERECSVQRRFQKIIEESPSPFLTAAGRTAMGEAAVKAGLAIDYVGAGTVEFIVGADGQFYFMEINTRIQVEHPVTEACLGLDLVEWQLRVAFGEKLPWRQAELVGHGHAIEARLYAEDPEANFLPASGKLTRLVFPSEAVRIDSGVVQGDVVSVFYDPMIAKLIVHAPDRPQALAALRSALAGTQVGGIKSNVDFLETLIRHPDFIGAQIHTGYLDARLSEVYQAVQELPQTVLVAASVVSLLAQEAASLARAAASADPHSPWARSDGWRLGHFGKRVLALDWRGTRCEVAAHGSAGCYRVDIAHDAVEVRDARYAGEVLDAKFDGQGVRLRVSPFADGYEVHDGMRRYLLQARDAFAYEASAQRGADALRAPMPGRIVALKAQVGDQVLLNQELMVMEAMKMELALKAPRAGQVAEVRVAVGDFVEADAVLLKLELEAA